MTDFDSLLKKHGYHKIGSHSAVKTCLWLNNAIRGKGSCYKSKFYGIASHRCIQMTPCLICNHRCKHCWRAVETPAPVPEHWDGPDVIADGCLIEQKRLVSGYRGADIMDKQMCTEAFEPRHVAISLAGEPTLYPYLPELIEEFHNRNLTTFVVTNGTNPDVLTKLRPTQLYLSLNAPDRETYRIACTSGMEDRWDRILRSLGNLYEISGSNTRTAIRLTLVKGLNMKDPEGYARLIEKAMPDYVEIKAYMHLGFSRRRLTREAMPSFDEIRRFAERVASGLKYTISDEFESSRVVLLANARPARSGLV